MKRLGEIIGFAESTVCLYETGQREPDNETLVKIANALDTSVDYLLGLDEKKEAPASGLDDRLVDMLVSLSPIHTRSVVGSSPTGATIETVGN